jgi:hypothetical protein
MSGTRTIPKREETSSSSGSSESISKSLIDAKGDIILATADDTPSIVAVGADSQVLTADSSQASGVRWATPSSGAIFITNVTSSGNTVPTMTAVPDESSVVSVLTDTYSMTVYVEWDRTSSAYEGAPVINTDSQTGVPVTWTSKTGNTHYGNAIITGTTDNIDAVYAGTTYSITVGLDTGPVINTAVIGSLPGSQTTVKAGDTVHITGTQEATATHIRLVGSDAFDALTWQVVSGTTFDITGTISNGSGSQTCTLEAKNASGTIGVQKESNTITLDQSTPVIGTRVISYPSSQSAFKGTEVGTVTTMVTDYTSITYSSPHGDFTPANTTTYENVKTITCTNPGDYNDSSTNFRIVARKASNNTSTTVNTTIEVADIAPVVTVTQQHTRLRSSVAGTNYMITCTSNQNLAGAPGLIVGVAGTWVGGGFSGSGKIWTRSITITDAHTKDTGAWAFSTIPTNNAGTNASISGNQTNGGFVSRDISLTAFSNEVVLGVNAITYTKCTIEWLDPDNSYSEIKDVTTRAALNTSAPVVGQWCLTTISSGTIRILDTEATGARSTASVIRIEEII